MNDLTQQGCEACHADAPKVTEQEQAQWLPTIPHWQVDEVNGEQHLWCEYRFSNFVSAQAFANKVCDLAEEEFHHPAITIEWGKVTVHWWTHKIGGLHKNDFICAAKTDALYPKG